jgi:hypothetical protein
VTTVETTQGRGTSAPRPTSRARLQRVAAEHAADARTALAGSWAATEQPPALAEVWRHVFPARRSAPGKAAWLAMTAAGLFRALVISVLWLLALAVATRIRAGVALAVVGVVLCVGALARALQ